MRRLSRCWRRRKTGGKGAGVKRNGARCRQNRTTHNQRRAKIKAASQERHFRRERGPSQGHRGIRKDTQLGHDLFWELTPAALLEPVFERCYEGVRVVGGLVHTEKQVSSGGRIADHEIRIKWAGGAWHWRRRCTAVEYRGGATDDRRGRWRRADATHILSHRRSLVVLVVPLLIVVFDSRRKFVRHFVLENHGNIVEAVHCFGIVHCGICAGEQESVRSGQDRWISERPGIHMALGGR